MLETRSWNRSWVHGLWKSEEMWLLSSFEIICHLKCRGAESDPFVYYLLVILTIYTLGKTKNVPKARSLKLFPPSWGSNLNSFCNICSASVYYMPTKGTRDFWISRIWPSTVTVIYNKFWEAHWTNSRKVYPHSLHVVRCLSGKGLQFIQLLLIFFKLLWSTLLVIKFPPFQISKWVWCSNYGNLKNWNSVTSPTLSKKE